MVGGMSARRPLAAVLAGSALLAAGCGSKTGDVSSATFSQPEQKAVASAVEQLATSVRKKDYDAICSDQVAAPLVKRLDTARRTGHCADRMEESLRDVTATDLAVRAIQVSGATAIATVQSTKTGSSEPAQRLAWAKEGSRWKLAGLA
jgi:ketosteroid isomerase-like protein